MSYYKQRLREIKEEQRLKNPSDPQPDSETRFNGKPNAFQVKVQKGRLNKLEREIELKQKRCDELYDKYAHEFNVLEGMKKAHKLLSKKSKFVVNNGKID